MKLAEAIVTASISDWLLVRERCSLCNRSFIVKVHAVCIDKALECPDCCRESACVEEVLSGE